MKRPFLTSIALAMVLGQGLAMASECIAHRGDSIQFPDNTVAAIASAWKQGADVVEVDVRMTADGELVLFHDAKISGELVSQMDYAQVQQQTPGYQVPSLAEALRTGMAGKTMLLDLKERSEPFLDKVIEVVAGQTPSGHRVVMQSTDMKSLDYLREHADAGLALFYVTDLNPGGRVVDAVTLAQFLSDRKLQGITAKGRQFVDADFLEPFHQRKLKYYVWTINEKERIEHYHQLGVDGIITDDPKLCREVLGPLRSIPSKELPLPGEVFDLNGHTAFLIMPAQVNPAHPVPWVWYAPTLPRLPGKQELWMFERFLKAGVAIAGVDVGESYGSPAGRAGFSQLYEELTLKRGMARKPCLLARSRGGLMLYNWAVEHPDQVGGIAGIYPVCNLRSYPGLDRACSAYGMTVNALEKALAEHNPIERLAPLAGAKVPVLHIHGDSDKVVPLEENSELLAKRYRAAGGAMTLQVIDGGGHDLNAHWFTSQAIVDFVLKHAR